MANIYYQISLGVFVILTLAIRVLFDVRRSTRRRRTDGRGSSNSIYLGFACALAQVFGFDLPMNLPEPYNTAVRMCGLVLALISCALMTWPRVMEVRSKTWASPATSPALVPSHELATSGPYRFIRHPYYLGVLLGFLATELCLASYLLVLLPYLLDFTHRVACAEEIHLEATYGQAYRDYKGRTWRLPPFFF
ncbi:MAG: isoprenylcysteine carboxylmethyltransferase family protein [Patescibacteria group bacterium]